MYTIEELRNAVREDTSKISLDLFIFLRVNDVREYLDSEGKTRNLQYVTAIRTDFSNRIVISHTPLGAYDLATPAVASPLEYNATMVAKAYLDSLYDENTYAEKVIPNILQTAFVPIGAYITDKGEITIVSFVLLSSFIFDLIPFKEGHSFLDITEAKERFKDDPIFKMFENTQIVTIVATRSENNG